MKRQTSVRSAESTSASANTPGISRSPTGLPRSSTTYPPTRRPKGVVIATRNTWLEFAWRRLRAKLETLSEAKAATFDRTKSGKPGSKAPAGDSELAHFDARWRRACSDNDRRAMLLCTSCADEDAKVGGAVRCCVIGALRSYLLTKPDRTVRLDTREGRETVARDERAAAVVAHAFGIRKSRVLAYRREFGFLRAPGAPNGNHNAVKNNGSQLD